MKKLKRLFAATLAIGMIFMFTACGGGAGESLGNAIADDYENSYQANGWYGSYDGDYKSESIVSDSVASGEMPEAENSPLSDRKIIYTANLDIETQNFDKSSLAIENLIAEYNGYISERRTYGNDYDNGRTTYYTIRIPAEHYADFMTATGDIGNVISKNESTNDVTSKYVDIEARLETMKLQKERFEEMLKTAKTTSDILTITEKIYEIQADIESYTAQLRALTNQIQMCTINLSLDEVIFYTPTDTFFGTELVTAFKSGRSSFVEFIQDLILFFAYNFFHLIFWGIVAVVIIVLRKRHKIKRAKKVVERQTQTTKLSNEDLMPIKDLQEDKK